LAIEARRGENERSSTSLVMMPFNCSFRNKKDQYRPEEGSCVWRWKVYSGQAVNEVDPEALPSFHLPFKVQKWTRRWFHLHSADERGEVELRGDSPSFPAFLFNRNKPSTSSE
jgi:hypothetical protein